MSSRTTARRLSSSSTTDADALTPFDEPSWFGLTMSGNFSLGDRRSRPVSMTWNSAVRIPCCMSTRFDSALSSAIDSVAASEPV